MVFSKSTCTFSTMAKELLESKGIGFKAVELDTCKDGDKMLAFLSERSGQSTLPNIWICKCKIGGFDELEAMT